MSELTILLVRHGVTDWNEQGRLMGRNDTPLNRRGEDQAQQAARAMIELSVEGVFASPQLRCQQTAASIAAALKLGVSTEQGLDEVWLCEDWQGHTVPELAADPELARVVADPTYVSGRLEPLKEVEDRAVSFVESQRRVREDATIALVSHGDPIRLVLAHYLAVDRRHFRNLTVDNGSISVLKFADGGVRLLAQNWKPELRAALERGRI